MTHLFDTVQQRFIGTVDLTPEQITSGQGNHILNLPEHQAMFIDFSRLRSVAVEYLLSKVVKDAPPPPILTFKQWLAKWPNEVSYVQELIFSGGVGNSPDIPMTEDFRGVLEVAFKLAAL